MAPNQEPIVVGRRSSCDRMYTKRQVELRAHYNEFAQAHPRSLANSNHTLDCAPGIVTQEIHGNDA
jgi:hypothetical protein